MALGVAIVSNPRASSSSVALPWVIRIPSSLWQFSGRLCKSTLIPIDGLVSHAYCKRLEVLRTGGVFWGKKKEKEKEGPFLMHDKGNAQECYQCWPEVIGSYFPISKPL